MINFYDVIVASEGIAVADEFAALWGRKISGGYEISTYTGVLPVTLQTVAGYLAGYKVWGNTGGVGNEAIVASLPEPLCGIDTYSDVLELSTGTLTRRIRKFELTGEENITLYTIATGNLFRTELPTLRVLGQFAGAGVCTHYRIVTSATDRVNGTISGGGTAGVQKFVDIVDGYATADDFKSFLAAQYAAGTPVTIWYVLAEPEISTVPVPSGLTGTIEGYLIQDGTPTPEAPIYPSANGIRNADDTYSIQYGYKLPILSNDTTTDIFIGNTQLAKDEYVDSKTGQIYRYVDGALVPTDPPVPLPQIPTAAGETTISYGVTGVQPEKVELKYRR